MAVYFLDSSAIVKRYVAETGTFWIRNICASVTGNDLYTAQVMGAEAVAAIMRRLRRGEIPAVDVEAMLADLQSHLASEYTPIYLTNDLVQHAMDLVRLYPLRGYDAVQLASALELQLQCDVLGIPAIIFISADNDLNAAASAEGLPVDNPNVHL